MIDSAMSSGVEPSPSQPLEAFARIVDLVQSRIYLVLTQQAYLGSMAGDGESLISRYSGGRC
jgi:hypothetical protein